MSSYPASIPRCQHLKINGTQCGSPALRRNQFCYFHKKWHDNRVVLNGTRARSARVALDLPVLEDANSIQVALMQVMRLILSGQVDSKTAGLLLYALQTASSNLNRTNFEPTIKTHVVIDPRSVRETPLGEDPWCKSDFEEEEEDEFEDDAESEAAECIQAAGADTEWSAEGAVPEIEAQAEAEPEENQTIACLQAVATDSPRPHRTRVLEFAASRKKKSPALNRKRRGYRKHLAIARRRSHPPTLRGTPGCRRASSAPRDPSR
jgi:hypothetical protein